MTHPTPTRHTRHPRRARLGAAILLTAVITVATCGDDDTTDGDETDPPTQSSPPSTQPPASDEDEAFPLIEELVVEANALIDELLQDPTAVEDDENEQIARLREIHTDDSPTPDGVIAQMETLNDNDQRERPAESGVFSDFGVYEVTALDDDTVRFRTCSTEDSETVDANDEVVDQRAQVTQGVGEARRIDGTWQVYGIHVEDDRTLEIEPGSANPGFCDDLFAGRDIP